MEDFLNSVVERLIGRIQGPLNFRFLLQPTVAAILAIRPGIADAKAGRTPIIWSLFTEPGQREQNLKEGWKSISGVLLLGIVMDLIYQVTVRHVFQPVLALLMATLLAIVPYLLVRAAVNRVVCFMGRYRKPG